MEKKHHHGGHRSRLRKRYQTSPESITDHELLELLLFYAIPQKDTNELAHCLLERFGSLTDLLFAPASQIRTVNGMGETSSLLFPLIQDLFRRHLKEAIERTPQLPHDHYKVEEVAKRYLAQFEGLTVEKLIVIGLDSYYRVIGDVLVSSGDQDSARVDIPNLSGFLLSYAPRYVVVAHNHPSGISLPSEEDFVATESLENYLEHWGIPLLDHLIFDCRGDYVSFLQSNDIKTTRPRYSVWLRDPKRKIVSSLSDIPQGPAPTVSVEEIKFVNNLQNNEENP